MLVITFVVADAATWSAKAQEVKSAIIGLWKLTSDVNITVASGETVHPFGEHPGGYYVFTRGGRVMQLIIGEKRKAPAGPIPTDTERLALFDSLLARSGTYKVEGTKLIVRYDASEAESVTGTERSYSVELDDNKLKLAASPFVRPRTGNKFLRS